MVIQLKANAVCPQIKLEKDLFKFGDCSVRDSEELTFTVENKNPTSKVDISFQKIPNFTVIPAHYTLKQHESTVFRVHFEPKTIGKIDSVQKLCINKIYEIDLRFFGIATTGLAQSRKRIQSIRESPNATPNNLSSTQRVTDFKTRSKAFSVAEKTFVSDMRKSTHEAEMMKLELDSHHQNKDRFNKFLIDRRTDRMDKQKEEVLQRKWSLFQTKLSDLGVGGKYE